MACAGVRAKTHRTDLFERESGRVHLEFVAVTFSRLASFTSRRSRASIASIAIGAASLGIAREAASADLRDRSFEAVPAQHAETASATDDGTAIEYEAWHGLSYGAYMAPKGAFVDSDGGVDVVVHFHAGQMSAREMRGSGLRGVFVSCGFGLGTGAYSTALANPTRFGRMLAEVVRNLERDTGRHDIHVRRLALASWSAGFAAIGKILAVDSYYAMVDTVVLLDSLHAQYIDKNDGSDTARGAKRTAEKAARGSDHVDVQKLRAFVRFARDAVNGRKAMVVTHSAIVPPDYASSTEATQALARELGVGIQATTSDTRLAAHDLTRTTFADATGWRGMTLATRADAGNLHVRGFRGGSPRDHLEHLHLIGSVLGTWVVPRWKREARFVYTLAGEQL